MNARRFFVTPVLLAADGLLVASTVAAFFLNRAVFWVELSLCVLLLTATLWRLFVLKKETAAYLKWVSSRLDESDRAALARFPFPALVLSKTGTVEWYNDRMRDAVLGGEEIVDLPVEELFPGVSVNALTRKDHIETTVRQRRYDVVANAVEAEKGWVLYFVDNTELRETAEEYVASRPAVMIFYIDNADEVTKGLRESERARMAGKVEKLLEDWIGETSGLLRKIDSERFMALVEHRHLLTMIEKRFDILDRVRAASYGDNVTGVTLSIGVGEAASFREGEQQARKALEMALGRGGDQAAVRNHSGYDFYGGLSRGVERHTKVRPRVIAAALEELIRGTDIVFTMGHKYADLDCLGASAALASTARHMGKIAYVVTDRSTAVGPEIIERYEQAGCLDLFLSPEEAREMMSRRSLVILTDTHNPDLVESMDLYNAATQTVIIDHHRRMAAQVEGAVIFYHESNASSASEMVAELVQYMPDSQLTAIDAEALLAGITLDTRNFVIKAGTRTFEAAGYLRGLGADTVAVKHLFDGSVEQHRLKGEIVAAAELYRGMALSFTDSTDRSVRIAASQAADELLSVKGVAAAFVLYRTGESINLSARSLGEINVQLIAEKLGGGGHHTMAGAQLTGVGDAEAAARLRESIDAYLQENNT